MFTPTQSVSSEMKYRFKEAQNAEACIIAFAWLVFDKSFFSQSQEDYDLRSTPCALHNRR